MSYCCFPEPPMPTNTTIRIPSLPISFCFILSRTGEWPNRILSCGNGKSDLISVRLEIWDLISNVELIK